MSPIRACCSLPPRTQAAHDAADTIVIESDEILDEKKASAALLMKPELMMFTDGTTIEKLLSHEDYMRLEEGLKQRGIPLAAVSRMRPWMISSVVALPGCEMARKAKGVQFLDQKIAADAVAEGKQVKGLGNARRAVAGDGRAADRIPPEVADRNAGTRDRR